MRDHRKLRAFQKSDQLALLIYQVTADFPADERFGLIAQMRRCAVSVPSNVVEGCARNSDADYLRFLDIAFGSLKELRYQWSLAHRLGFVSRERFAFLDEKLEDCVKTMAGLVKKVRRRVESKSKSK